MPETSSVRHVLITGASRGIGAGIARAFASRDYAVTLNFGSNREAAEEVAEAVRAVGGRAAAIQADVADIASHASLLAEACEQFGPVGVLVNNAGVGEHRDVSDNTLEDFDRTFAVNVRAAFALTEAVLPAMRQQRSGRLIFLSSMAAVNGGVVSTPYAASKAALLGMMRHYAANLVQFGITANAIAPALVESDMVAGLPLPPVEQMPLGRLGRASEVGDVARLLAECEYLNGQTIHLNAGRFMT